MSEEKQSLPRLNAPTLLPNWAVHFTSSHTPELFQRLHNKSCQVISLCVLRYASIEVVM